jgi:CheY-like chemotaxis protein
MKKILIADDDPKVTLALTRRLEANGYSVRSAPDGFAALKLAKTEHPDLILMDIWMPVGIGLSVAERMKELGLDIPVIFLTASRKPGLRQAAEKVGGAAFIEKPYDPQLMLETIEQVLDLAVATPVS